MPVARGINGINVDLSSSSEVNNTRHVDDKDCIALNKCNPIFIIKVSCVIHLRASSQEVLINSAHNLCLEITLSKLLHLPGVNELTNTDQGWGLLSLFPPFRYFPNYSALSKHALAIKYHVYIWQVSPQLSCGDTCQYECDSKNLAGTLTISKLLLTEILAIGALVTPTPALCLPSYVNCDIPRTVAPMLGEVWPLGLRKLTQECSFSSVPFTILYSPIQIISMG